MLSYQHAFHAGNFADVLKHLVLAGCLEYMTRKPAPFLYVDTHAGSGCYKLKDPRALKTSEAQQGILALDLPLLISQANESGSLLLGTYLGVISPFLQRSQYPGSPAIAAKLMREQDRLALFDLHPAEFINLERLLAQDKRVKTEAKDGFDSISLLPPIQKRALVMIDPSWERKEDLMKVVEYVRAACKRMPGCCLLVWYPVIHRENADLLVRKLFNAGATDLWQCELGLAPDSREHGMTASGILMINPPWQLPDQLKEVLPLIQRQLAPVWGHSKVECLVKEAAQG